MAVRRSPVAEEDLKWMALAVEEAEKTVHEKPGTPKVGAVAVCAGEFLGSAHRGEVGEGAHAEFSLMAKLDPGSLEGATVYTTLEPCCARVTHTPCAEHLVTEKVREVVIGSYDPNPAIYQRGWRLLHEAGVKLRDFDAGVRAQILALNADFIDTFRRGVGLEGSSTFDYRQQNGQFVIDHDGHSVATRFTTAGHDVIHAGLGRPGKVALARERHEFQEIDDPGALDFTSAYVTAEKGDIVVFRSAENYALVKIGDVLAPKPDDGRSAVEITWQLRLGD